VQGEQESPVLPVKDTLSTASLTLSGRFLYGYPNFPVDRESVFTAKLRGGPELDPARRAGLAEVK
jgi:hypothetical protein